MTGSADYSPSTEFISLDSFTSNRSQCFCVQILQDDEVEGSEEFFLIVRQNSNQILQNVSIIIRDDDVNGKSVFKQ